MSAFSPLGQRGFNPITTPLPHSEQTNRREFEPLRGEVRIARNIPVSDKTHLRPIVKTHNSNASPDIFEPPATRRKLNKDVSFPDF